MEWCVRGSLAYEPSSELGLHDYGNPQYIPFYHIMNHINHYQPLLAILLIAIFVIIYDHSCNFPTKSRKFYISFCPNKRLKKALTPSQPLGSSRAPLRRSTVRSSMPVTLEAFWCARPCQRAMCRSSISSIFLWSKLGVSDTNWWDTTQLRIHPWSGNGLSKLTYLFFLIS